MTIDEYRHAGKSDVETIVRLVNGAYRPGNSVLGWTHQSDLVAGERVNAEMVIDTMDKDSSVIVLGIVKRKVVACVNVEKDHD